ncbi:MAG: hypothetical protein RIE74_04600 [Pseudomonadales bacterium]
MRGKAEMAATLLIGTLWTGPGAAEPTPDLAFLEYLGMLVEADGELLDPLDLASLPEPDEENDARPATDTAEETEDAHEH